MVIKTVTNWTFVLLKIAFVISVNIVLFSLIAMSQGLFGKITREKSDTEIHNKILIEMVKLEKKEEKKPMQQRIRQVAQSSGEGKGTAGKLSFSIQPDLGVGSDNGVAVEQQGNMEAAVFEEGEVDETAVLLTPFQIPYPARALELGVEGTLEANLTVGIDGKVINIDIISSPHSSITAEARKVFSGLKFKPAKKQGMPVVMKLKQVVEFKLN